MSFEVGYSAPWAHTALCADLTWTSQPPDEFILANQRLLAQHYRVSQILQDTPESQVQTNHCDITEKRIENGNTPGRRSVKDVIPESRLAQFYGNFYYDEHRESCYTNPNEVRIRPYCAQGCENCDVTECWMLPEVEYWFRKLMEDPSERNSMPRRRRQYRIPADDDFERWGPTGARTLDEATLEAKVRSVKPLWQRAPSPPRSTKMRARRRQPRRLSAPAPPLYCLDASALVCDPTSKAKVRSVRPLWQRAPSPPRSTKMRARRRQPRRLSAPAPPLYCLDASALVCDPTSKAKVRSVRPLWQRAPSPPRSTKMRARRRQPRRLSAPAPPLYCLDASALVCDPTSKAKVRSVRPLWQRAPSPPRSTKMRARRRQPRRLSAPAPPLYCLDASALVCDPTSKFHFETPRPPLADCQRAMSRYSASMQALMRATAARCPLYRGTNVSRYAPTGQRPLRSTDRRCSIWWPRDQTRHEPKTSKPQTKPPVQEETKTEPIKNPEETIVKEEKAEEVKENETPETKQKEKVLEDGQVPSTSTAIEERKKRLYSTVLSMSPPINIAAGCLRLSQKLAPGILKLNPKIVLQTRLRSSNVDNKFEELEKEALEQYKGSDESIDSKFQELEKEAVEQYSTSNSNTSCSSGNSGEKKPTPESDKKAKFHKEKSVESVVINSRNFPDLNARGHSSVTSLKNSHAPQRGEKKEQMHRPSKASRNTKSDSQRAGSDTDYESRNNKVSHKGARWTQHMMPPKKRHISACVSDFSSDDDLDDAPRSIKDGPCIKNHLSGKVKMSAHGAGDLQPIMRKT